MVPIQDKDNKDRQRGTQYLRHGDRQKNMQKEKETESQKDRKTEREKRQKERND